MSRNANNQERHALATTLILAVFAAGLLASNGCAVPPKNWTHRPLEAGQSPCGDWVFVRGMDRRPQIAGELFAIEAAPSMNYDAQPTVFIHDGRQLIELRPGDYDEIISVHYNAYDDLLWAWTAGGMAASLSHGLIFPISGGLWLVVGGITSVSEFQHGRTRTGTPESKWARYPQGLPEGFEDEIVSLKQYRGAMGPNSPELMGGCPFVPEHKR